MVDHVAAEGGDGGRDLQAGHLANHCARESVHAVGADLSPGNTQSISAHIKLHNALHEGDRMTPANPVMAQPPCESAKMGRWREVETYLGDLLHRVSLHASRRRHVYPHARGNIPDAALLPQLCSALVPTCGPECSMIKFLKHYDQVSEAQLKEHEADPL